MTMHNRSSRPQPGSHPPPWRAHRLSAGAIFLTLLAVGALSIACGSRTGAYEVPTREYEMPVELEDYEATPQTGSLWTNHTTGNHLFSDQRAFRVGDLLTIEVDEAASGKGGADTSLSRESEYHTELGAFFGLMTRLVAAEGGNLDPNALIEFATKSSFKGRGQTGRSQKLTATVQVMVRKVLPNGNLFIEGHRVILVNEEEHHFYLSGVARPVDIDDGNVLHSSMLADADIQYTGRGVVTDQQSPGYGQEFMNWGWPW